MAITKKTPVKRKYTKKEVPLTKKELAKKKVEELLEGVTLTGKDKEVVVDRLEEATKGKNVEWLGKQVAALTETNTKLTDDYSKLLNDYQLLKQGGGVSDDGDMKHGIERIFFELDSVLTGEKFGVAYPEAKIRPLLNKFMGIFPFLQESLTKKKTITQKPRR